MAAALAGGAALLASPGALAHGRGPAVALDYRFRLAPAPAGVQLRVLDGDRSLEARVGPSTSLLVRGYLREPMLRFDARGVFANAASPTAQADRLTAPGAGWKRVAGGRSYAWHDHRLAPAGERGRFQLHVDVDGRPAVIGGSFVRIARPALWPWFAGAACFAAAVAALARRRPLRLPLALVLGLAGGLAALAGTIGFALRDRPGGGVGWVPIGAALAVAAALALPLVRLSGRRRGHAAGAAGAVAAAATLAVLPVFWHGVVISAFPADVARLLCALALLAGGAAAALSMLPELDG